VDTVLRRACLAAHLLALPFYAACDRRSSSTATATATAPTATTAPTTGEVRWLDPNEVSLRPGPVRRDALSAEQMARVTKLHETLKEVDPSTLDEWVDGFKRDINPDSEIQIWEAIAAAYAGYTGSHKLDAEAKKDVFKVLLVRSAANEEGVLAHVELKVLSKQQAREVMSLYAAPARPITAVREQPSSTPAPPTPRSK